MSNIEKRFENDPDNHQDRPSMDDEIWVPPDETPAWVIDKMPNGKTARQEVAWRLLYEEKPDWWNAAYGLGVVNSRRRQVYRLWLEGELQRLPDGDCQ